MWLVVVEFGKSVARLSRERIRFGIVSTSFSLKFHTGRRSKEFRTCLCNRNLVFNTFSFYVIDIIDTAFSSFRGFLIAKIVELWNGFRDLMRF